MPQRASGFAQHTQEGGGGGPAGAAAGGRGGGLGATRRASITERDAQLFALTQGLVPVLNTPGSASGSSLQSLVMCAWPFGGGSDLPLVPPPLAPGVLPEVNRADFERYRRNYAAKFQRFEGVRRANEAFRAAASDLAPGQVRHAAGEGLVLAMRQVPAVFFTEDFSLARPETWAEVCGEGEGGAEAHARLDAYAAALDEVEGRLLQEIAARSPHFFEAAGVVQDLRGALSRTFATVAGLRGQVRGLEAEALAAASAVRRLRGRRKNLTDALDKVKLLEGVAAAQEALGLLVGTGDLTGALDVLADLRAAAAPAATAGIAALRPLPQQLAAAGAAIDELLAAEFLHATRCRGLGPAVDCAIDDLQQMARMGSGAVEDALAPLVAGLRRTGKLPSALAAFRDCAVAEVKQAVRELVERTVPLLLGSDEAAAAEAPLADRLAALRPADFERLLGAVMVASRALLGHAADVRATVAELLCLGGAPRAEAAAAAAASAEAVQAVADAAGGRWAKLLGARAEAHARLRLPELRQLLAVCGEFTRACEAVGARPLVGLRTALAVQCRAFLDAAHTRSLTQLTGVLEREPWTVVPVAPEFQRAVDELLARGARASAAAVTPPPPSPQSPATANGDTPATAAQAPSNGVSYPNPISSPDGEHSGSGGGAEVLGVGGRRFHAVGALLMLALLLGEYGALGDAAPGLAGELAHRVVELLNVFNSRTCQLVLGAGALAAAGLRSITARHLALAAQALAAVLALHPALTAAFTAPVPLPRRTLLLPEFERVAQDLAIHRGEIHGKLVAIMRERLAHALEALPAAAAAWAAAPPPRGPPPPFPLAAASAKQLRILGQVLMPLLQLEELRFVFGRIAMLFSRSLAEAYGRLQPLGAAGEAQAAADLHHLLATLRALPLDPATAGAHLERLAALGV
ncbi:hypothetical protein WJX81_008635 [Elliptochloris bilobata]|uniref:Vacuolar protein sorting-associated protein 54 C-terminal domain-containing protein n=1 Tax=Elliptochloris bilobata TaxID=381761 RepID=A0AAW1RIE4_9CHLO